MTNTVQSKQNHRDNFRFTSRFISALTIIGVSLLLLVAHEHGDGTVYSTGYEFGSMLAKIVTSISIQNSIGLGSVIAIMASWERNKSILWSILHAVFGWVYVAYYAITRNNNIDK